MCYTFGFVHDIYYFKHLYLLLVCLYHSLNRGELNKVKGEADAKTKDSEEKAKTIAQVIILTLMLLVPNLAYTK